MKSPDKMCARCKGEVRKEPTAGQHVSARVEDKFGHCDYLDLVEVGGRDDSNCSPGGKFLFKVLSPPVLHEPLMLGLPPLLSRPSRESGVSS